MYSSSRAIFKDPRREEESRNKSLNARNSKQSKQSNTMPTVTELSSVDDLVTPLTSAPASNLLAEVSNDEDYEDVDSTSIDDSDADDDDDAPLGEQESFWDRIAALSLAFPSLPSLSISMPKPIVAIFSTLSTALWTLSTASFLLLLPLALELEKESAAFAQENSVKMQQQLAAQQVSRLFVSPVTYSSGPVVDC